VLHYGQFFVPTGKNLFDCDGTRMYSFFPPRDTDGVLFGAVGPTVLFGVLGLTMTLAAPRS
jgi:hypothetical protein